LRPWARRLGRLGLADTFWALWDLDPPSREALVASVARGAARVAAVRGRWWREAAWTVRLAEQHPRDAGAVVALLMNLLRLDAGEAMFVPAGRLHAYLHGVGIEVMASSDNVIRGGLTTKHVDLAELGSILDVRAECIEPLRPRGVPGGIRYPTPAPDFAVTRLAAAVGERLDTVPQGPEILLCLSGRGSVEGLPLQRGAALFVPACSGAYTVEGPATVWRATVGAGEPAAD
jgi:mannose-6-phosphate isomerase